MPFDPDKYLAEKQQAFDPDAYLAAKAPPSEIPQRRRAELFGGVSREVAPAMGLLSPEQKREALKTGVTSAAGLAAGPVVGGAMRFTAPALEAIPGGRTAAQLVSNFGRAIESGGLAPGLGVGQRIAGGATAGGLSSAVASPEDIETGTAIGAATPSAMRLVRPFVKPLAASAKEVKAAVNAEYGAMRDLNEAVSPEQFNMLAAQLDETANKLQYLPSSHSKLSKAFQSWKEQSALGQPVSIDRLDKLRKEISRGGASGNYDEREISKALVREIDDFVRQAAPSSASRLEAGRSIKTQESKTKIIDNVLSKAARSKAAEPSETIKNEFYKISKGDTKRYAVMNRQFSPDEQDVIRAIGEGRLDINALENIGAVLAPPRMLRPNIRELPRTLAQLGGYGFGTANVTQQFGLPVATGLAAAAGTIGYGSRAAANRLAMMQAAQLRAQILNGSNRLLAPEVFPQVLPTAIGAAPVNFLGEQGLSPRQ